MRDNFVVLYPTHHVKGLLNHNKKSKVSLKTPHVWDVDGSENLGSFITDHAQDHLGDIVYVELSEVRVTVTHGESFGVVESVKATSDINSPVSGKVVEVNEELMNSPGLVNTSPYEDGWIMKVEIGNSGEVNSLIDSDQYFKLCEEEDSKH